VERFGNTLFVAYDDGLLARDGTSLARVDFGVKGDVDGHRPWREALARPSMTTAMSHIAIQEKLDGKAVNWMEHVTDDQYRR
jgi:hypothetical protein